MPLRTISDAHRVIFDWLAAGGTQDPPRPEMKLGAAALMGCGLVKIRRRGGKWTADLTEMCSYYVEHGRYLGETEKVERSSALQARRAGRPARIRDSGALPDAGRGVRTRRSAAGAPGAGSVASGGPSFPPLRRGGQGLVRPPIDVPAKALRPGGP